MATPDARRILAREHRWIHVRLVGWAMLLLWQVVGLVSEFVPLELDRRAVRVFGRVLGLVGLAIVAYGFERVVETAHERAGLD